MEPLEKGLVHGRVGRAPHELALLAPGLLVQAVLEHPNDLNVCRDGGDNWLCLSGHPYLTLPLRTEITHLRAFKPRRDF